MLMLSVNLWFTYLYTKLEMLSCRKKVEKDFRNEYNIVLHKINFKKDDCELSTSKISLRKRLM